MLAKKLFWTGVLVAIYALVATAVDYAVNVYLLHTPSGFTPVETVLLSILIGVPSTYYLISQRMDLRRVVAELRRTDTNLRRTSEEFAESEARYRLLTDASPDIIIRYDTGGRVEYLSPAARRYGWDPETYIGSAVADSLDPSERDRNRQFLQDLAAGRPVPQGEENVWRSVTPDGRVAYFEGRSSPIRRADGAIVGAVANLRDVTERRQAAAALQQSEQKLRGLFELAPVGIALTDMAGRYIEFNDAFREICGYSEVEIRGLDYWKLTPPEYAEQEALQLDLLKERGRYGPFEKEYVRKDGSRIPLRLNGLLIEGPDGEPLIWSIVEDITEQRRAEAVLIEARNAAEAATVAKSEFLANMSHEIRTPLTGMLGFAGLLERLEGLPPLAEKYVGRIATSGQALLLVVNDILDFSKLDADRIELDPHPFDPAALVAETVELVAAEAAHRGLDLRPVIEGPMPAAVEADSSRVRQVLLNLLTNAIKFTDAGGVTITVSHETGPEGRLRISVADTGVGIPADRLDRLFQRFSQVDGSITRQYGGTGLGLAISRRLTEMMGGEIGVESEAGAGSTFWFTVTAPEAVLERAEAAPVGSDPGERSARILVVDDVPVNRELVRTMLAPFGFDLIEASSGAEAVAAAMAGAFDLILMDLQMPGMDGMEASLAIRQTCELNRATPIVALSANVMPEHRAACREAGMDDHIAKPISPTELITKIVQWTAGPDSDAATEAA